MTLLLTQVWGQGRGEKGWSSPGRGVWGALSEEAEDVGDFAHSEMGIPECAGETGREDSGAWERGPCGSRL